MAEKNNNTVTFYIKEFFEKHPNDEIEHGRVVDYVFEHIPKARGPSEFEGFTLEDVAEAKFAYLSSLHESGGISGEQLTRLRRFRDFFVGVTVNMDYFKSVKGELQYNPTEIYEVCSQQGIFHDTIERFTDADFLWNLTRPVREATQEHQKEEKDKKGEDDEDEIL